jgi:multidrug resistance efflux pump
MEGMRSCNDACIHAHGNVEKLVANNTGSAPDARIARTQATDTWTRVRQRSPPGRAVPNSRIPVDVFPGNAVVARPAHVKDADLCI